MSYLYNCRTKSPILSPNSSTIFWKRLHFYQTLEAYESIKLDATKIEQKSYDANSNLMIEKSKNLSTKKLKIFFFFRKTFVCRIRLSVDAFTQIKKFVSCSDLQFSKITITTNCLLFSLIFFLVHYFKACKYSLKQIGANNHKHHNFFRFGKIRKTVKKE